LVISSASRGSSMNSDQRPSGRSVIASRPSSSACQVSSGVFMSPGNRVARPTTAMSTRSIGPLRVQSVSSESAELSSGSPSTIQEASDSIVGCSKAAAIDTVTPVRSSISAAIATASRDDRPSSTIGVTSSIASGDCPVALETQFRSHSRTSATVMSVRAGLLMGSAAPSTDGWESRSVSVMFAVSRPGRERNSALRRRCAGCRRCRRRGRRGGRSCRWRYGAPTRPAPAARRARSPRAGRR
jgi:hypothetical protein